MTKRSHTYFPTSEEQKEYSTIPNFGGRYGIKKNGEIWDKIKHRRVNHWNEKSRPPKWNHTRVSMIEPSGHRVTRHVARLVAETYLPYEPFLEELRIKYKDGNYKNVHLSNLEWEVIDYSLYKGDQIVYFWFHALHGFRTCKRKELRKEFVIDNTSIGRVIRGLQSSAKGWRCLACEIK